MIIKKKLYYKRLENKITSWHSLCLVATLARKGHKQAKQGYDTINHRYTLISQKLNSTYCSAFPLGVAFATPKGNDDGVIKYAFHSPMPVKGKRRENSGLYFPFGKKQRKGALFSLGKYGTQGKQNGNFKLNKPLKDVAGHSPSKMVPLNLGTIVKKRGLFVPAIQSIGERKKQNVGFPINSKFKFYSRKESLFWLKLKQQQNEGKIPITSSNEISTSYSKLSEIQFITISLASSKKIRQWAEKTLPNGKIIGQITNPNTLHYKTFKPIKGGLFCDRIFGPLQDFQCACGTIKRPQSMHKVHTLNSISLTPFVSKETKNNKLLSKKLFDFISKGRVLKKVVTPSLSKRNFCPICDVEYTFAVVRRYQLGYIQLASPVTHVWYLKANPSYLSMLFDMKKKDLEFVIYCSKTMTLQISLTGIQNVCVENSPNNLLRVWKKLISLSQIKTKMTPFENAQSRNSASSRRPLGLRSNPKGKRETRDCRITQKGPCDKTDNSKGPIDSSYTILPFTKTTGRIYSVKNFQASLKKKNDIICATALLSKAKHTYLLAKLNKQKTIPCLARFQRLKPGMYTIPYSFIVPLLFPLQKNPRSAEGFVYDSVIYKFGFNFMKTCLFYPYLFATVVFFRKGSLREGKVKTLRQETPSFPVGNAYPVLYGQGKARYGCTGKTEERVVHSVDFSLGTMVRRIRLPFAFATQPMPFGQGKAKQETRSKAKALDYNVVPTIHNNVGYIFLAYWAKEGFFKNSIESSMKDYVLATLSLRFRDAQRARVACFAQHALYGHSKAHMEKRESQRKGVAYVLPKTYFSLNSKLTKENLKKKAQYSHPKGLVICSRNLNPIIKNSFFKLVKNLQYLNNLFYTILNSLTPIVGIVQISYLQKLMTLSNNSNLTFLKAFSFPSEMSENNSYELASSFSLSSLAFNSKAFIARKPMEPSIISTTFLLENIETKAKIKERLIYIKRLFTNFSSFTKALSTDPFSFPIGKLVAVNFALRSLPHSGLASLTSPCEARQRVPFRQKKASNGKHPGALYNESVIYKGHKAIINSLVAFDDLNKAYQLLTTKKEKAQLTNSPKQRKLLARFDFGLFKYNTKKKIFSDLFFYVKNVINKKMPVSYYIFLKTEQLIKKRLFNEQFMNFLALKYAVYKKNIIRRMRCFSLPFVFPSLSLAQRAWDSEGKTKQGTGNNGSKVYNIESNRHIGTSFRFEKLWNFFYKDIHKKAYNVFQKCQGNIKKKRDCPVRVKGKKLERVYIENIKNYSSQHEFFLYSICIMKTGFFEIKYFFKKLFFHFILKSIYNNVMYTTLRSKVSTIIKTNYTNSQKIAALAEGITMNKKHTFCWQPVYERKIKHGYARSAYMTPSSLPFAKATPFTGSRSEAKAVLLRNPYGESFIRRESEGTTQRESEGLFSLALRFPFAVPSLRMPSRSEGQATRRDSEGKAKQFKTNITHLRCSLINSIFSSKKNLFKTLFCKVELKNKIQENIYLFILEIIKKTKILVKLISNKLIFPLLIKNLFEQSTFSKVNCFVLVSYKAINDKDDEVINKLEQSSNIKPFAFAVPPATPLRVHKLSLALRSARASLRMPSRSEGQATRRDSKRKAEQLKIKKKHDVVSSLFWRNHSKQETGERLRVALLRQILKGQPFPLTPFGIKNFWEKNTPWSFHNKIKEQFTSSANINEIKSSRSELYNNIYTLYHRQLWETEWESQTLILYLFAGAESTDLIIPAYKNRLKNDSTSISWNTFGAGIVNKMLVEFDYNEQKKMNKQNRILLFIINKKIEKVKNKLKFIIKKKIKNKFKQFFKDLCNKRDILIRRTKLIRLLARWVRDLSIKSESKKHRPGGTQTQSMILTNLPVLPPDLRPILRIGNEVAVSDLNRLYQRVVYRNDRLKKFLKHFGSSHPYEMKYAQRLLQEAVDNLIQNGKSGVISETDSQGRFLKSLSDILKGKQGRFRQYLLGKRVDYSARSVIVVGPKLQLHECGIPKEMALELYLPFLIKRLLKENYAKTVITAKTLIKQNIPLIWQYLREIMETCPVLLNRAPTLHRLGFQSFQPKLVEGKAILLHPLVCPAFNADFDGDQMAVHVPLTMQARTEAWKLMLSRNNLLSPATGEPILLPSQDMVLGCYYLTTNCNESSIKNQSGTNKYFKKIDDVLKAYNQQKIDLHAVVWIKWDGFIETNHSLEQPLEIRITSSGNWQILFMTSYLTYHFNGQRINQYIRTTPGKILFNTLLQKAFINSNPNL
uniref:DNA-directed RNA polymerase subunit beta' n=1 Tax=Oogamochlamys gigantea TaxID=158507 RepID=A0A0S2LNP6_9CHLO|nr:beta' subunit of RNA polymerase [Oogamochlamys gigantea]ALO62810.1 beta' subunit of RNA polymerase [Oogamochlamys gigantea]